MFEFEVCANGVESAVNAAEGGATRVELCAGIPEGGTTPSYGTLITTRRHIEGIPTKLHIIIRPRGGDFLYSTVDLEAMCMDIRKSVDAADGFVFGCLRADGSIDTEACRVLIEAAEGKSCTFHRAFDMCADPLRAIDQLAALGFSRILTSGGRATAEEGIPQLQEWQQYAEGHIQLMAGCGVTEHNIKRIYEETGITAFHFSAREQFSSGMTYRNENAFMGQDGADEYVHEYTTANRVRRTINALRQGCI